MVTKKKASTKAASATAKQRSAKGQTRYYAYCRNTSHGVHGWTSNMYVKQGHANNAKKMHEKMYAGHNAVVLTINV
ncbi:MAG TPA: hypothetical protein DDW55_00735 [Gammaproteobacteria bacterium]|nr:hypothetical protein [Gammaproteobacteria bacterium]